eukprot:370645-Amphidinium_carterae.1
MELLSGCLLDACQFAPWAASRWATLGPASRSYVVGSLLGCQNMCSFLHGSGILTEYDVAGMQKLDARAKTLLITTALIAYPFECIVLSLLTDSRLAMHGDDYQSLRRSSRSILHLSSSGNG